MFIISLIVYSLLFSNNLVSIEKETTTYEASPSFDTRNWINIPITFDYYYNNQLLGVERVSTLFPHQPVLIAHQGLPVYTVIDQDGLEYSLAAIQVPSSDFDLNNSVNFLIDGIKKSSKKKLLSFDKPEKNDSPYHLVWIEENKITRLTLIRSSYFIYFLETSSVSDGIQENSEAIKAAAFVKSFAVLEGFSLD